MKIRLLFIVTLLAGIVSACGEKDIAVLKEGIRYILKSFI